MQTFGLYELSIKLDEVIDHQPEGREVIEQPSGHAASTLPVQVLPLPPWQPWIQTHLEHLSPDRQVLLGVGLMLHAAPSIVRTASFAAEVKAWHTAIRMASLQQPAPEDSTPATVRAISPTTAEVEATQPTEEKTRHAYCAA